jgi:hypothetical protein
MTRNNFRDFRKVTWRKQVGRCRSRIRSSEYPSGIFRGPRKSPARKSSLALIMCRSCMNIDKRIDQSRLLLHSDAFKSPHYGALRGSSAFAPNPVSISAGPLFKTVESVFFDYPAVGRTAWRAPPSAQEKGSLGLDRSVRETFFDALGSRDAKRFSQVVTSCRHFTWPSS